MKTFAILMAFSFVAPAAFAETDISARITNIECRYKDSTRGEVTTVLKSDGKIGLVVGYLDENKVFKADAVTLNYASLTAGDADGLTLMASRGESNFDLIMDSQKVVRFYNVNGVQQDAQGLNCIVDMTKN